MLPDVQIRTRQTLRLERPVKRLLVHGVAPSDVDDDAFARQFADKLRVQEVVRPRRLRQREDHPVRATKRLIQRRQAHQSRTTLARHNLIDAMPGHAGN